MKNSKTILVILICSTFLFSCEKEERENDNFYNIDYRIGLWVSPNKIDTLKFIDSSTVIRKGLYHLRQEYSYKIKNNIFFLNLPGGDYQTQTQHTILEVENERVILDNMYYSIGSFDNSGTFIKQQTPLTNF